MASLSRLDQPQKSVAQVSVRWHIDQQAIGQGLSSTEQNHIEALHHDAAYIWQEAERLAALQPIVSSVSEEVLAAMLREAKRLRGFTDRLVVIGTGGASLGAQTLCAFAEIPEQVAFLENCDAQSAYDMLHRCDLARTSWVVISKSGETVETLAASLALIAHYETAGVALAERVVTITSPGARPLRALAERYGWALLDHPPTLGGRFSVFSTVGLFPAAYAGLDVRALNGAAQSAWKAGLAARDETLLTAASWFASSLSEHPLHVVMAYGDRLRPYTQWYKQLWAESLGKEGQGPTPVTAVGAVDQHSQLQLYLDGAPDKLFTLILPDGAAAPVPLARVDIPEIAYLGGHTMGEIMQASADATFATLKHKGLPLRALKGHFSAESLCQLMVRTILETLLVAAMLKVDPYSQPAVEEGKQRARRSLGHHG